MENYPEKFMALFSGMDRAYGTYQLDGSAKYNGSKLGGQAVTVRSPVTIDLWNRHLSGACGVGIIPIRDDSTCLFGAVDIDVYPLNLKEVAEKILSMGLPILPCRSKSGGVHGYVFFSSPCPAKLLVTKLKHFHTLLAYGDPKKRETFPKQTQILIDRGDLGNWINMPYFGGEETERYGIKPDGTRMTMAEFVAAAESIKQTPKSFKAAGSTGAFPEGPPCLQALAANKFSTGFRNQALTAICVYARKSNPNGWEADVREYNATYMAPPLDSPEVERTISSMGKKGYLYSCGNSPLVEHCDNATCKKRKFGVADLSETMVMGSLTKLDSSPPIWFMDVDLDGGRRIELTTEALQNQVLFQKRCMEVLNTMPPAMDKIMWMETITKLLKDVQVLEVPQEATPEGQLLEFLEMFLTGGSQGKTEEDLLTDRPYLEGGNHLFKLRSLKAFLKKKNFVALADNQIVSTLKKNRAQSSNRQIGGKHIRIWSFPEIKKSTAALKTPEIEKPAELF